MQKLLWNMKRTRKINKNFDVTPAINPSFTNTKECERGRKRTKNEDNWEQKHKKQKRASGCSYSPYKVYPNAKVNQGRSLGEPCKGLTT